MKSDPRAQLIKFLDKLLEIGRKASDANSSLEMAERQFPKVANTAVSWYPGGRVPKFAMRPQVPSKVTMKLSPG